MINEPAPQFNVVLEMEIINDVVSFTGEVLMLSLL
jgi:hypothetical protein